MKWEHKCSLAWLRARQNFLTATDIRGLLPVTKTGRPRKVDDVDRMKVFASKLVELTDEDCMSYGVMARGHMLEPYAIDALNQYLAKLKADDRLMWWDDKIVSQPGRLLAFSPDAMDVPMGEDPKGATVIAEVKCYAPDRHVSTACTPKDQIEERWQIASAMALLPSIDHAYLVLFNPSLPMSMRTIVVTYDRDELEDEIKVVRGIEDDWHFFLVTTVAPSFPGDTVSTETGMDEGDIVSEIERDQERAGSLNPA